MGGSNISLNILISAFLLLILFPSLGECTNQKVVLTLRDCIKRAIEISPEIAEARYEEEIYKSKKLQADSAVYPQIELLAVAGPSPDAKDENFLEIDKKSSKINGVFGSVDFKLIQPIHTFGKITAYKEAASSGIRAARAGIDKKRSDIALRISELYYGLLLAKEIKDLILEIRDELVESIKKAERQIEIGSPWADEVNLFKLRAFLGEVDKNLHEAEKNIELAKEALMTSIGIKGDIEFDIVDTHLTPEDRIPLKLEEYLKQAVQKRPEIIQLKEGLNARNWLINVEKSKAYPELFLGINVSFAGSTNRERLDNPYVRDYFNHAYGFPFLGIKWSFDFGITEGRIKEAQAEYYKLLEKKRFAEEAFPFQVKKAYLDMQEASKNIKETEIAYKNARKWLIAAIANFDMGLVDAKEIADAAISYGKMKAENLRSIYNHRISYVNLLYASGLFLNELN